MQKSFHTNTSNYIMPSYCAGLVDASFTTTAEWRLTCWLFFSVWHNINDGNVPNYKNSWLYKLESSNLRELRLKRNVHANNVASFNWCTLNSFILCWWQKMKSRSSRATMQICCPWCPMDIYSKHFIIFRTNNASVQCSF